VEESEPAVTAKPKPSATGSKKLAASGTAKTGKSSTTKVTGKKSGTAIKAVYKPPGKGANSAKKKATVVRVHEVKRGDTLTKLASRYGVTIAELKKRNKLAGDTIVVGKRLTID
jgi:LysM repeat protein